MGAVKSFFGSRGLAELLLSHRRQMMLLPVWDTPMPQYEDDLQPLRPQRPQGGMVSVPPGPLAVVVGPGPLAVLERGEGELVQGGPQGLVAGEAEADVPVLPTPHRHRDHPAVPLEMAEGGPAARRITELGPERRHRGPVR